MAELSRVRAVVAVLVSGAAVAAASLAGVAAAEQSAAARQSATIEAPATTFVNQKVRLRSTFTPARKGRKVQLLIKEGRRWRAVDVERQDRRGRVTFDLAARRPGAVKVRTRAMPHRGLAATTSSARTIRVKGDRIAIADSFHALTPREAASATYDPATGRLVFDRRSTPAIRSLAAGDLLTIPPSAGIRSGALVEVVRVQQTRKGVAARTRSASLVDVVQNIPDDATSFAAVATAPPEVLWAAPGVDLRVVEPAAAPRSARLETLEGPTLQISLSESLDLSGGYSLSQEGSLSLTPLAQVELDTDWGDLKSYKLGVGAGTNLEYTLGISRAWTGEMRLATVRSSFRAMIGWVPFWMDSTTDLVLTRSVEGKLVLRAVAGGQLVVGVEGDEDADGGLVPNPYADVPEAELTVEPGVAVSAEVGPKVTNNFSVYSVGGPELSAAIVAGAQVEDYPSGRECSVFVRADAGIAVATSAFFEKLTGKSYETSLSKLSVSLKDSPLSCGDPVSTPTPTTVPTTAPSGTPTPTPTPEPDLRVLASFLPKAYQHDAYSALLVASESGGTWRVAAGVLPPGVTLGEDGTLTGTSTGVSGTYVFTAEVTVEGRTATREFQVVVEPAKTYSAIDISNGMACGHESSGNASCWWHTLFWHPDEGDATNTRYRDKSTVTGPFESIDGTCGLRPDRSATCWTRNRYTWDFNDDIDVLPAPAGPWREVTGDGELGCGVRADGSAECWTIPLGRRFGPVPGVVPGAWESVSLDEELVCGVRADGSGACFDRGLDNPPVEVGGAWAASRDGRCGVDSDGTAGCLWDGVVTPTEGMDGQWSSVSGWGCGIRLNGDLECSGSLGGDFRVEGPWTSISGQCGVKDDGTGWCWGGNWSGEVGNGSREDAPQPVQLPGRWSQLVSDGGQTCGLQIDASGWCWGNSPEGDRPSWYPPIRLVPTRVQSGP